jgi:protein-S-isoprenylcysteine O-methyltransferase Ste14
MGSKLSAQLSALVDYLSTSVGPGPKCIKLAHVINLQKGGTLLFCLGLMHYYDNWTPTAWMYTALHGSYGLCWLLKEAIFPDPGWQKKVTVMGAAVAWFGVLAPYWLAPYLCIANRHEAPGWVQGATTFAYTLGVVLMMGSDAQKYYTLKHRRGLITDGFFAATRNPNYLGEMMLYGSFAALSGHREPWYVLGFVWSCLFLPNMVKKDKSMARYPEWAAYTQRSGLLLPWIPTLARSLLGGRKLGGE